MDKLETFLYYLFFIIFMKVLMLGTYNLNMQPKSMNIFEGLKKQGVEVQLILETGITKYFKLAYAIVKEKYDVIFATGHFVLIISKMFSRKPVLFDIYISAHDTLVLDRKKIKENSILANLIFFFDKLCCKLANGVTIDTKEYANFFVKHYGLNRKKVKVIYLGGYNQKFFPRKKEVSKKFIVEFHGTFIPIHGIETILYSANTLNSNKDIEFHIIGKGQTYNQMISLSKKLGLSNVIFLGRLDDDSLLREISNADVCLGMFGTSQKSERTISNKVFEYLAMKKPFITGDSPAVREILESKKNCILSERGNYKELTKAILLLKNNSKLRQKIAKKGYFLFKKKFTTLEIGKRAKRVLESLIYD
jgi:glycosyltransferase involved in cell wall biosynthesis